MKADKVWKDISEIIELESKGKKLTTREKRRLKEYKVVKAKTDKLSSGKCKGCGGWVPLPIIYCSSKCREEDEGKKESKHIRQTKQGTTSRVQKKIG